MKKLFLVLTVVALSVMAHLSCGTTANKCADIQGDYNVTKTFHSVSATKGGGSVTVENGATVFADTSVLSIDQSTCAVVVQETVPTPSVTIPYFGGTDKDDTFSFSIQTPSSLDIPLSVTISGTAYICHFSGQITWDGTKNSSSLNGTIDYELSIRSGQLAGCPDTLTLKYTFAAAKK